MSEAEEMLARAMEPPVMLRVYQAVAANAVVPEMWEQMAQVLRGVLRDKPAQFRSEWRQEEKAWREAVAALEKSRQAGSKVVGGRVGEGPVGPAVDLKAGPDPGSERAEELTDRLLEELAAEAKAEAAKIKEPR